MDKNIILIGYMGSGKSAVGKQIAEKTGKEYLDLDDYIEEKENLSISEIFKERGEIYFRKTETKYLRECLVKNINTVISLGGGTPCFGNNMTEINRVQNSTSVYLQTSITELSERLFSEKSKRPLISHTKSKSELTEFIGKHIFERAAFYSQSKFVVKTDGKSVNEIAKEVISLKIN